MSWDGHFFVLPFSEIKNRKQMLVQEVGLDTNPNVMGMSGATSQICKFYILFYQKRI